LIKPAEIKIPNNILLKKNPVIEQIICLRPELPKIPEEILIEHIEPDKI